MFPTVANSTTDLVGMLGQSKVQSVQAGQGGKTFVRFDPESGDFSFGQEQEDITNDEIIVNIMSFSHGWTLWSGGKPTKREVHFTQELPMAMEAIGNDSPSESRSFEARFADDEEVILSYGTTTYGGKKGCDSLLDSIKLKAAGGEATFLFPVVKLTSESYANSKRGGKLTFNPIFTIVDWMDAEGTRESATAKIAAPKTRRAKAAPVEEEADAPVAEAPKKRRRKAAS